MTSNYVSQDTLHRIESSDYWKFEDSRIYENVVKQAKGSGMDNSRISDVANRRMLQRLAQYDAIANYLVECGYTRVTDNDSTDHPDWFIWLGAEDKNNLVISRIGNDFLAVTSGPVPDWVIEKALNTSVG